MPFSSWAAGEPSRHQRRNHLHNLRLRRQRPWQCGSSADPAPPCRANGRTSCISEGCDAWARSNRVSIATAVDAPLVTHHVDAAGGMPDRRLKPRQPLNAQGRTAMLHVDIPTQPEIKSLARTRGDACVSLYLPTTTLSQDTDRDRLALKNLALEAAALLEAAGVDKRQIWPITEQLEDLVDDDAFWRLQSRSLAVFVTPEIGAHLPPAQQSPADGAGLRSLSSQAAVPCRHLPARGHRAGAVGRRCACRRGVRRPGTARGAGRGAAEECHGRGRQGHHRPPLAERPHPRLGRREGAAAAILTSRRPGAAPGSCRPRDAADPRRHAAGGRCVPLGQHLPASGGPADHQESGRI